jgi:hypothetical protein
VTALVSVLEKLFHNADFFKNKHTLERGEACVGLGGKINRQATILDPTDDIGDVHPCSRLGGGRGEDGSRDDCGRASGKAPDE